MASGGSRRLGKGEVALIVVVTVLVLVFVLMLVQRLGSGGERAGSASPTPAPVTATQTPTPTETAEEEPTAPEGEDLSTLDYTFVTPSGNIACAMEPARTVCAIASFTYEVPEEEAAACEGGNVGHFLEVTGEGTRLVCDTSGPEPTIDIEGVPVLDYGQTNEANGFACISEETGVTCTHEGSGRSIALRRADFTL